MTVSSVSRHRGWLAVRYRTWPRLPLSPELVASATRGKRRVIGVVLGSGSREQRLSEMTKLLDAGLARDVSTRMRLATLLISTEDEGSPPIILSGPTCAALGEDGEEIAATTASAGSWAIIFGSYTDKAKAQMALAEARRQLGVVGDAGTATIAAKSDHEIAKYSPMIVDLTQLGAARACKTLRAKNLYCLALSPEILGTSSLAWR